VQGKGFEHSFTGKIYVFSSVDSKIGQVYKETIYFIFLRRKG
jgi:hypothetical protein